MEVVTTRQHILQTRLRAVNIRVVDYLGIPEPLAKVWLYEGMEFGTGVFGRLSLPAVPF